VPRALPLGELDDAESRGIVTKRVPDRPRYDHLQVAVAGDPVAVPVPGEDEAHPGAVYLTEQRSPALPGEVPVGVRLVGAVDEERMVPDHDGLPVSRHQHLLEEVALRLPLVRDEFGVVDDDGIEHDQPHRAHLDGVVVGAEHLPVGGQALPGGDHRVRGGVVVARGPVDRDVSVDGRR